VVKVSHNGFDTHSGQQGVHARLLKELAELEKWWGINSGVALNGKFTPIDVL
jgi:hypothetical protein